MALSPARPPARTNSSCVLRCLTVVLCTCRVLLLPCSSPFWRRRCSACDSHLRLAAGGRVRSTPRSRAGEYSSQPQRASSQGRPRHRAPAAHPPLHETRATTHASNMNSPLTHCFCLQARRPRAPGRAHSLCPTPPAASGQSAGSRPCAARAAAGNRATPTRQNAPCAAAWFCAMTFGWPRAARPAQRRQRTRARPCHPT